MKKSEEEKRLNQGLAALYREAREPNAETEEVLYPQYHQLKWKFASGRQGGLGRYSEEKRLLGEGGIKKVYAVYDDHMQRDVAYATVRDEIEPFHYEHFISEARLTASLSHPNIIKVYDMGLEEPSGSPYFTMDLKQNRTLSDLIGAIEGRQIIAEYFLKVCDAVSYAHAQGVMHLDLKPDNIQCNAYGEVLLCDWGLARYEETHEEGGCAQEPARGLQDHTLHGEIRGTLGYMAPEQVTPGGKKTPQTDIYALGAILYEVVTGGCLPIDGQTHAEMLRNTRAGAIVPLRRRGHSQWVSKGLRAIIMRALALRPDERYLSVDDLKLDLLRYIANRTTEAERPSMIRSGIYFLMRHQRAVIFVIVSISLVALIVSLFAHTLRGKNEHIATREEKIISEMKRNETLTDHLSQMDEEIEFLKIPKFYHPKEYETFAHVMYMSYYRRFWDRPEQSTKIYREILSQVAEIEAFKGQSAIPESYLYLVEGRTLEGGRFPEVRAGVLKEGDHFNKHAFANILELHEFSEEIPQGEAQGGRPSLSALLDTVERYSYRSKSHTQKVLSNLYFIIHYDWATRQDKAGYNKVAIAALSVLNQSDMLLDYSVKSRALRIESEKDLYYRHQSGAPYSLFSYMDMDRVTLKVPMIELDRMTGGHIRVLDVSECSRVRLNRQLSIEGLEELIIHSGQLEMIEVAHIYGEGEVTLTVKAQQ